MQQPRIEDLMSAAAVARIPQGFSMFGLEIVALCLWRPTVSITAPVHSQKRVDQLYATRVILSKAHKCHK